MVRTSPRLASKLIGSAAALAVAGTALGAAPAAGGGALDVRPPHATARPAGRRLSPAQERVAQALRARAGRPVEIRVSDLTGGATRVHAGGAPLSAPRPGLAPGAAALEFVRAHRELFAVASEDVEDAAVTREIATRRLGTGHVTLQQRVAGIPVYGATLNVSLDREGRVVSAGGEWIPRARAAASGRAALVGADEARTAAALDAGILWPQPGSRADQVFFPLTARTLRLAWRVTIWDAAAPAAWESVVDAFDGRVLARRPLVASEGEHGAVYAGVSPVPDWPMGSTLGEVAREDLPFDGRAIFAPGSAHYDWWNDFTGTTDRTTTKGNNVFARDATTGKPASAPDGNFTFENDPAKAGLAFRVDAGIANAFYHANRLHDLAYDWGFDEAAGNYQYDNHGLGGVGGDGLRVDVQAQDVICNAFSYQTDDGSPGLIRTGTCDVWDAAAGTTVTRDVAMDSTIVAHEFGHSIHQRTMPSLEGNQYTGEGWADFFSLAANARETDNLLVTRYAMGAWGLGADPAVGIRRQPYSVDQSVFTRTYANLTDLSWCTQRVCNGDRAKLCSSDADCGKGDWCARIGCVMDAQCQRPISPIEIGTCDVNPYGAGEIWAETMWIARANAVWRLGTTTGPLALGRTILEGMLGAPDKPDFLDVRDALLRADQAQGGLLRCALWDAFARMGIGASAASTGPQDRTPTAGFDVPAECRAHATITGGGELGTLCPGQTITRPFWIDSDGAGDLLLRSLAVASNPGHLSLLRTIDTPFFVSPGDSTPHDSLGYSVDFGPMNCLDQAASLTLESNSGDRQPIEIPFSATADHEAPTFTACPPDRRIQCGADRSVAALGSAAAADGCDPSPSLRRSDSWASWICSGTGALTRTWTATDACGNADRCVQTISVVDTTPPVAACNAPATVAPPSIGVSYTATAQDGCGGPTVVDITGWDCFAVTPGGKRIDRRASCGVTLGGAQITIGGGASPGTTVTWKVRARDCSGNAAERDCSVQVVKP